MVISLNTSACIYLISCCFLATDCYLQSSYKKRYIVRDLHLLRLVVSFKTQQGKDGSRKVVYQGEDKIKCFPELYP